MQMRISLEKSTSGNSFRNAKAIRHSRHVCSATLSERPDEVCELRNVSFNRSADRRKARIPSSSKSDIRSLD